MVAFFLPSWIFLSSLPSLPCPSVIMEMDGQMGKVVSGWLIPVTPLRALFSPVQELEPLVFFFRLFLLPCIHYLSNSSVPFLLYPVRRACFLILVACEIGQVSLKLAHVFLLILCCSFIASATCFSLSICVGAGLAPLVSLVTHPPDSSSTSILGGPQCGSWNWCSSHRVIGVALSQFRCSLPDLGAFLPPLSLVHLPYVLWQWRYRLTAHGLPQDL